MVDACRKIVCIQGYLIRSCNERLNESALRVQYFATGPRFHMLNHRLVGHWIAHERGLRCVVFLHIQCDSHYLTQRGATVWSGDEHTVIALSHSAVVIVVGAIYRSTIVEPLVGGEALLYKYFFGKRIR